MIMLINVSFVKSHYFSSIMETFSYITTIYSHLFHDCLVLGVSTLGEEKPLQLSCSQHLVHLSRIQLPRQFSAILIEHGVRAGLR